MIARSGNRQAIQEMEANIVAARDAMDDPQTYGELTNQFSLILTQNCGNRTIHIFAQLIQDIVERQHVEVTVKTYSQRGVDRLRDLHIRSREKLLELVLAGKASEAETLWRRHLERSGDIVFSAYRGQMPIDVVQLPQSRVA
jgi:DNA-binding GntR family transcriptional regulator